MPKTTTAFGILFEAVGISKAVRSFNRLAAGVDSTSGSLDEAAVNAAKLTESFDKGKVGLSRMFASSVAGSIKKMGGSVVGLSKNLLSSSASADDLGKSLLGVVDAIPVVGPLISKSISLLGNMAQRVADLRKEQISWQINLAGIGASLERLTPSVGAIAETMGESRVEVMKLARSYADLDETMVNGKFTALEFTKQSFLLSKAFDLTSAQAADAQLALKGFEFGVQGTKDALGGVLALQQQYKLPELMQELPEVMSAVRASSVQLGTSFRTRLMPTMEGVAKAAAAIGDRLKIAPKEASKMATGLMSTFQEMAFNIDATFAGVDSEFDAKTKNMMRLFAVAGRDAGQAFEAIKKAGEEADFTAIATAFSEAMSKSSYPMAQNLRINMIRDLGPQMQAVMEKLAPEARAEFEKKFGKVKFDEKTTGPGALYDAAAEKAMAGFDKFKVKMDQILDGLATKMTANTPKLMEEIEKVAMRITTSTTDWSTGLSEKIASMDEGMAKGFGDFAEAYINPIIDTMFAKMKGWTDPFVDSIQKWGAKLGNLVDELDDFMLGLRDVFSFISFGKVKSGGEVKLERIQAEGVALEEQSRRIAAMIAAKDAARTAEKEAEARQAGAASHKAAADRQDFDKYMEQFRPRNLPKVNVQTTVKVDQKDTLNGAVLKADVRGTTDSSGGIVPGDGSGNGRK